MNVVGSKEIIPIPATLPPIYGPTLNASKSRAILQECSSRIRYQLVVHAAAACYDWVTGTLLK